jgi:glutamate dehydrogenase
LTEDSYLSQIVETAFPKSMHKKYQQAMIEHPLHKNIIATQLSNKVVNQMGFTYVYRIHVETGASVDEIIRAFATSSHIFDISGVQKSIEALDFKIPMNEQYEMLYHIRNLLNLSTRWFLHNSYAKNDLKTTIEKYVTPIKILEKLIPNLMVGHTKQYLQSLTEKFLQVGLPKELAKHIATYRGMYTALNIVDVATKNKFDLLKTAQIYFKAGERINLVWFRDQIAADSREGHWNILARLTLRDELDFCQRAFTIAVMQKCQKKEDPAHLIQIWIDNNPRVLQRWEKILEMLHNSSQTEYSMFFIAIRELLGLITTSQ